MPNYCDNELTIKGRVSDIDKFLEECVTVTTSPFPNSDSKDIALQYYFDFEKVLPTPTFDNESQTDNWYTWRINNWGTKWNNCETYSFRIAQTEEDMVELHTFFTTAWCPPDKIYAHLAEKYKDTTLEIEAKYYEGGCAFAGEISYHKGEVTNSYYVEYKSGDKENNIEYYTYLLEEDHESHEWMEDYITECMEQEDATEKEIEEVTSLFNTYYRRNRYQDAAQLYVDKTND